MEDPRVAHAFAHTVFVAAARDGELRMVKALWRQSFVTVIDYVATIDSDFQNGTGWTALLLAVSNGHVAIARFLLERGASTTSRTYQSLTSLHLAAVTGNVEMINLLFRFRAHVDAQGVQGKTALHLAVAFTFPLAMARLLDHGASTEVTDDNGKTPLQLAIANHDHAVVKLLITAGADVLRKDSDGDTVLTQAVATKNLAGVVHMVETLKKLGATETVRTLVNMPCDMCSWTPVNAAADRGYATLVVFLVRQGADIERPNAKGYAPLTTAVEEGHDDIVRQLLTSGAAVDTTESGGRTPLMIAAGKGFRHLVDLLVKHGATIDHRNHNGYTALLSAALDGDATMVETLMAHGANSEIQDHEGWTALLQAAQGGHLDVVRILVHKGADVDCVGHDHWTPLTIAANNGHTAVCALLLERGASTILQRSDGQTALHLAAAKDRQAIIALLLAAGVDPSARDFHGRTPAQLARMGGHVTTAERLEQATGAVTVEAEDLVWPRHILEELYGGSTSKPNQQDPSWYIDRASIASLDPCARLTTSSARVSIGTWSGSRVVIVEPTIRLFEPLGMGKDMKRLFREEVSKLYPLRHPHVIKLYGACHRDAQPFLVMEHAPNGTLPSFVAEHKPRTWAILYEAALGLQYLHERGIRHGHLMGDNILIGDDGLVKLSAFGLFSSSTKTINTVAWEAPEVVLGQKSLLESDVYALGMCIVEAVSGAAPYASEAATNENIRELVTTGIPPTKPTAFGDREWQLVLRMIRGWARDRMKMSDVVRELAALAQTEAQDATRAVVEHECTDRVMHMEETLAIALSLLPACRDEASDQARELETPQHQVFHRLYNLWQAFGDRPSLNALLGQVQDVLSRYVNDLRAQGTLGSRAARFAAQRQYADRVLSFHNELDRIVDEHDELLKMQGSSATATTTSTVAVTATHMWRDRWHAHRRAQLQAVGDSLTLVDQLDVESATCLLFELTKRRDAYTSIPPADLHAACEEMRSMPDVHLPDWFIPHYEVAFDQYQSFSRGAFGSVHHGEWMGSRAVIKKVFADDDAEFEKEVAIWSQLYHPHVLQLFGACHVGDKFLVSEFASLGQLDRYLRSLKKQPAQRTREVWRTLYEAALGLQYLHARGIVHCDLKCNNILIGRDGKAKVSDYGLSRKQQQENEPVHADPESVACEDNEPTATHTGVGAPRWKAPEVLNGAEPTLASDVYAFGMCIVEAVTGEFPWGMDDPDELVSDHVRRGGALFEKPQSFSAAQWALVVGACRFDPKTRLSMVEIVDRLCGLANDAIREPEQTTNDEATNKDPFSKCLGRMEPEPEVTASSAVGAFSAVAVPMFVTNQSDDW